jgi:hypothetical protein
MDDYEKELYMVQGFAAASGSVAGAPGSMLPGVNVIKLFFFVTDDEAQ